MYKTCILYESDIEFTKIELYRENRIKNCGFIVHFEWLMVEMQQKHIAGCWSDITNIMYETAKIK